MMKRIFNICMGLMMATMMMAQTEYLPISVFVEEVQEPFPHNAQVQMSNKLTQLLTQNGIASLSDNNQFVLTVFAVPQNKEVLGTAPAKYVETMEMTFYLVDILNENIYATTSQTVRGVGNTDSKAYMDAIKKINIQSNDMKQFVQVGKEKILAYYDHEGERILANVRTLIQTKEYEQAMYQAMSIPAQCRYYNEAQQVLVEAYQAYVDQLCVENLMKARMAWAAEQNSDGAIAAGEFLQYIYPDASCYADAMALYKEVKGKVLDDWKFEMKQYNDQIDLEKQRIQAAQAIGVAYGNHQQPTTTHIGFIR